MADSEALVKLPNHMTVEELVASGKSLAEAKRIMAGRVFGTDHKTDDKGVPIEQGIGSASNPFKATHEAALAKARAMQAAEGGLTGATADVIAAAVAAGVKAGLAAAKGEEL